MRGDGLRPGVEGLPASVPVTVSAPGSPARAALWKLVAAAQADDPLASVTVAVPSAYAGLSLRHELGHRRGLVNVRFAVLARVAELLGAPLLAASGRVPLGAARRLEAVHAALQAAPGPFAAVARHAATEAGLDMTLRDLRRASPDALASLRDASARGDAVADLYDRFRALTVDTYDDQDLVAAAADAVRAGAEDELGSVIVFAPRHLSFAEGELLAALADAERGQVVVVDTEAAELPVGTLVVSAPDPEEEARAVLRRLLARAEAGTPLHEMAVLYPVDEPYARLLAELLESAGIPWNGPSARRLADSVAGRVLVGAVDLTAADFARDAVAAWWNAGPILDVGGRRLPGARWDLVSRAAGVVGGAEQWRARLGRRHEELDRELSAARADDDTPEWLLGRIERDRGHVERLNAFVEDLLVRAQPPAPPTWSGMAEWAAGLLDHYLGGEGRRADWPEDELDAARRVDAVLHELGSLDAAGAGVDLPRFRAALDLALTASAGHHGRFGTGLFVGPLGVGGTARFETVAVVGATEGSLPTGGREDPFLPDARRAGAGLPTTAERRRDQRLDYVSALAGADTHVLAFPRADPRAQQTRQPSRWVLETLAAHVGRPVGADEVSELNTSALDVIESAAQGLAHDREPVSLLERDLRSLSDWRHAGLPIGDHPLATGALGRGYALAAERASKGFTAFDGNVGASAALGLTERPVGTTTLQDWATCPFRFLLGRVLRVREVPRPEASDTLSAVDEGSLIHAVLERFVGERRPTSPAEPWDDDDVVRLDEIVGSFCDDAEARGITGRPLLWRFARRRIRATAHRFLRADTRLRREHGAVPAPGGLEAEFGGGGAPGVTVPVGAGRAVTFRGRIDRVDVSPDGNRAVVYDYKTGSADRYAGLQDDPVEGGTLLQLPIYALAAEGLTGASRVDAYYWFTRLDPDDATRGYAFDESNRARFEEVVATIVDGVEQGCFPAFPGDDDYNPHTQRETFSNCFSCPYDRLCPADRGAAWVRKADDRAVEPFLALDAADA